jgi:vancomycin aglycone glucosyltransferase
MRVLLSTIGSRGDVQPLVALALALRSLGQDVRLCVPPDFRVWIEGMGMPVTPIGPEVQPTGKVSASAAPPTLEQRRRMMEGTVATQFETISAAAEGCDIMVGATTLQVAGPSVAERLGIPYVFAAYAPAVLPSPRHAPPVLPMLGQTPVGPRDDYSDLWVEEANRWNTMWRDLLNAQRVARGLTPVAEVFRHVITDRPWLAADATLSPWPDPADGVLQTGAWILPDDRPLDRELEAFLDAGEPPVYFGFGSNRVPDDLGRVMVESARALGRRAVVLRGWADLSPIDDGADCFSIGEVNQQALFPRVAAVVHHGGAGTTTAAALGGAPQVVIPQHYDQPYFAERVEHLGIGVAHRSRTPTTDSLTAALARALERDVAARARAVGGAIRRDGARIAAEHVIALARQRSA